MTKTIISATLLTLLSTTILSTGAVSAATTADMKSSDAAVLFTEKSDPLMITAVPNLHFGTHEIDRSKANDYPAVETGTHIGNGTLTTSNVVSIQDDRSQAKLDGWDLQVQQTEFANAGTTDASDANPSDILTGVNIWFKTDNSTIEGANKGNAALIDSGNQTVQVNTSASSFMQGDATSFGSVKATLGTPATSNTDSDAMFLHVPNTVNPTATAHYQSVLTWTLVASPTAP